MNFITKIPAFIFYYPVIFFAFISIIIYFQVGKVTIDILINVFAVAIIFLAFQLWRSTIFYIDDNKLTVYKKFRFPLKRKFVFDFLDIEYVYINNSAVGKFRSNYLTVFLKNKPKQVFTYDISTEEMLLFVEKLKEKGVTVSLCKGFVYEPPKKVSYKRRQKPR